ncbi:hypothetical protein H6G89_00285 [Oscillatoria sp. FACHB-1407]|uniref:hypothetical protein n=1 Tax=Oscillatoria sp. FACHB-1407 TaxID=2692847 RepID=UPI0016899EC7|nr:hypothetical protein [Oscillatoria sp. FACHB-1407]MBD2459469.1 hypothetical protein [Oscillatoria sp. FACHB-1407]
MKQSQAEIQAIQEKLRAIQANRTAGRNPLPAMVEMTPNTANPSKTATTTNSTTATAPRPQRQTQQPQLDQLEQTQLDSAQLAAVVEQLQQQTAYLRQFQAPLQGRSSQSTSTQPTPKATPERQVAQVLQRLERQAQHINDLSAAQEAAILEWKAIAEQLERDRKAAELEDAFLGGADSSRICEYLTTAVPYIERDEDGSYVMTARSVDLFKAEREASAMAQTLRHRSGSSAAANSKARGGTLQKRRASQSSDLESWGRFIWQQISAFAKTLSTPKKHPSLKTTRSRQSQAAVQPAVPEFSLQDAAMWVLGSVIVRVALDLFLVANPGMWLPVIAVIAAPAAIAVYRVTVAPESGLVWGYRLFLIMIGLLLGGRL